MVLCIALFLRADYVLPDYYAKRFFMIKDKLNTIGDDDARRVAEILLNSSTSSLYEYTFEKIVRQKYDVRHGVDAEESVNVFFDARVKDEAYRKGGWKNKKVMIQLIERDRYHDYPHFNSFYREEGNGECAWRYSSLSNYIEAVEYLQAIKLL